MDEEGPYGLRSEVLSGICALAQKYDLERLVLFGSRARGDNRPRSDIDLACSGGDFARFSIDVDELVPTLLQFDFVSLDGPMQAGLAEAIDREGVVLYAKQA